MATFKLGVAYDPNAAALVANAQLEVFAEADTNFATPLSVTLVATGSSSAFVPTNAIGVYESFSVAGHDSVFIKSGTYATLIESPESIRDAALAAQVAAEAAQAAAEAAAADGGGAPAVHASAHNVGGSDPLAGVSMSQITDLEGTLAGSKDLYMVRYDTGTTSWPAPPSSPSPPHGYARWGFVSEHSSGATSPHLQTTSGKDWSFLSSVDNWVWFPHHTVDPT